MPVLSREEPPLFLVDGYRAKEYQNKSVEAFSPAVEADRLISILYINPIPTVDPPPPPVVLRYFRERSFVQKKKKTQSKGDRVYFPKMGTFRYRCTRRCSCFLRAVFPRNGGQECIQVGVMFSVLFLVTDKTSVAGIFKVPF